MQAIEQLGLALPRPPAARIEHALGFHLEDLSDFEFNLVVQGRIVPKKNHMTVYRVGKHISVGPDGEYKRWAREATEQLAAQWGAVFREPLPAGIEFNLRVLSYLPDRRLPDLSATYEGPQDVLEAHKPTCGKGKKQCRVHAGIYANDRWIRGHDGSDVLVDPHNPRVELRLTPRRRSP